LKGRPLRKEEEDVCLLPERGGNRKGKGHDSCLLSKERESSFIMMTEGRLEEPGEKPLYFWSKRGRGGGKGGTPLRKRKRTSSSLLRKGGVVHKGRRGRFSFLALSSKEGGTKGNPIISVFWSKAFQEQEKKKVHRYVKKEGDRPSLSSKRGGKKEKKKTPRKEHCISLFHKKGALEKKTPRHSKEKKNNGRTKMNGREKERAMGF